MLVVSSQAQGQVSETIHNYGQAVVAVILAALLSGVVALFNRLDKIEGSILHRDYLEERLDNMEQRIEKIEVRSDG